MYILHGRNVNSNNRLQLCERFFHFFLLIQTQAYVKLQSYTLRTYTYKGYNSQGTCKLDGVACQYFFLIRMFCKEAIICAVKIIFDVVEWAFFRFTNWNGQSVRMHAVKRRWYCPRRTTGAGERYPIGIRFCCCCKGMPEYRALHCADTLFSYIWTACEPTRISPDSRITRNQTKLWISLVVCSPKLCALP